MEVICQTKIHSVNWNNNCSNAQASLLPTEFVFFESYRFSFYLFNGVFFLFLCHSNQQTVKRFGTNENWGFLASCCNIFLISTYVGKNLGRAACNWPLISAFFECVISSISSIPQDTLKQYLTGDSRWQTSLRRKYKPQHILCNSVYLSVS